jgi:hypothetical protein
LKSEYISDAVGLVVAMSAACLHHGDYIHEREDVSLEAAS